MFRPEREPARGVPAGVTSRARSRSLRERLSDASFETRRKKTSLTRARLATLDRPPRRPRHSIRLLPPSPPSSVHAPAAFIFDDAPRPRCFAESRSSLARVPAEIPPAARRPRRGADLVTDASSGESSAAPSSKKFISLSAGDATPPRFPTTSAVRVFVVVLVSVLVVLRPNPASRFSFPRVSALRFEPRAGDASASRASIFSTFGGVSSRSSHSSGLAPGGVATSSAASHAPTSESRSVGAGGANARGGVT